MSPLHPDALSLTLSCGVNILWSCTSKQGWRWLHACCIMHTKGGICYGMHAGMHLFGRQGPCVVLGSPAGLGSLPYMTGPQCVPGQTS